MRTRGLKPGRFLLVFAALKCRSSTDDLFVNAARTRFVREADQVKRSLTKWGFRGEHDPQVPTLLLKK